MALGMGKSSARGRRRRDYAEFCRDYLGRMLPLGKFGL